MNAINERQIGHDIVSLISAKKQAELLEYLEDLSDSLLIEKSKNETTEVKLWSECKKEIASWLEED